MKKLTIILDAAHGSNVLGKCSPDGKHREFAWSRKIISMLKPMLTSASFSFHETVTDEFEPGLGVRVQRTNAFQGTNKFLISFHNNAAGNEGWKTARGVEIWTTRGQTTSDSYAEIIMNELRKNFLGSFPFRTDKTDGDQDKEENWTVLMCQCPAVLIEWLFQDNVQDVALLADDHYNQLFCESVLSALELIEKTII